jgi:enoyl-CoA hydratase/carnithine racemase
MTLSHPGRFNAMSRAMWRTLRVLLEGFAHRPGLRCVVVAGADGHFCAGGDISEYSGFRFEEASLREFHEDDVWGGLAAMLACDLPVVAEIHGHCMGAGVEIASCCDLRLASVSARFGAPIAKLGFPMAPREAQLVTRALGELTAREMLLAATVFDAPELKARGFLSQVCPDANLADEVNRLVERITALGPRAAQLNKQTLRALRGEPPADLLAHAYRYAPSAEHREGVAAFMAKRPAQFEDPAP